MNRLNRVSIAVALLGAVLFCSLPAASASKCATPTHCVDTRSFVATVTGFRTSKEGARRVLTVTVRFENKTAKPLTLGYVSESGVALDDLGNRYVVPGANAVRAIGEISGASFDPKFVLQPGEGSDARFELSFEPGKAKTGAGYELDLAIREIVPTNGDQFRLGPEYALHFAALGAAAPSSAAAAPAKPTDPCAGSSRCFNAGNFIAEVMQVTPTAMAKGVRHHSVAFNIRFRNLTDKPLILAYQASSSAGVDNFGNAFTWGRPGTYDTSVKGMGVVSARSADTQFVLSPQQTRTATFGLIRFNAVPPIGEGWNYNLVIEEVEIQPGQVVRSVRQNSVNFANLTPGTFAGAAGSLPVGDAEVPADAQALASKMIDLLNKKANKN